MIKNKNINYLLILKINQFTYYLKIINKYYIKKLFI